VATRLELTDTKLQEIYFMIFPTPLCLPHFNKEIKSYTIDYVLDTQLLTYSYLIDHTDPSECINCYQLLSVKHILRECSSIIKLDNSITYTLTSKIFIHSPIRNILDFTKNVSLYDKL